MRTSAFLICVLVGILGISLRSEGGGIEKKPSLEEREKTLHSMLILTKKDVLTLFPKHAEKLWPSIEQMNKQFLEHREDIRKRVTDSGSIKKVLAFDLRADKTNKDAWLSIPANVGVFEYHVETERGIWEGGPCFYLNGRWVWILDFPDEVNEILSGKK